MTDWTNTRRVEYLRSVRNRLLAIRLLCDAATKGTLPDLYAPNDEVRRAVSEIDAVIQSYEAQA